MSASAATSGALPPVRSGASATSRRVPRGRALLGGLLLAGGLLAGCGGGEPTLPEATRTPGPAVGAVTTAPDGVQEVVLETGDDYVFTPAAFTVAPGPVRVTVRNVAEQMTHNFEFTPDAGPAAITEAIPYLAPGDSDTVEFTVSTPGDYPFECSFHVAQGQVGTMTVTEG
ncbi:plastocyanin/azurin family copper-binding protein [Modestobacter sp. URMC 112]